MRSPSADWRFRMIYEENYEPIRSYSLRRVPVDDVNDVLADVFLAVWRRIDDVPSGDAARLWLYGVARNCVANSQRSRRRSHRLRAKLAAGPPQSVSSAETVVVRNESADEAFFALEKLKPLDREMVQLRVWEELSSDEIAEVVGSTPAAVAMRLSRAHKRLNRILTDDQKRTVTVRPHRMKGGESP
ncbi:MAG: sigma-70 family RNA polymerase sigma factor [Actinomycetia bacterium]|nr:sigma-70 family RNA polymerase sigma factor [Actinomycetes bacterium]